MNICVPFLLILSMYLKLQPLSPLQQYQQEPPTKVTKMNGRSQLLTDTPSTLIRKKEAYTKQKNNLKK